jgi:hypothetical protein
MMATESKPSENRQKKLESEVKTKKKKKKKSVTAKKKKPKPKKTNNILNTSWMVHPPPNGPNQSKIK